MRMIIVGADFEENLGMGMIAAAAKLAGHQVQVLPFNTREQIEELAGEIQRSGAEVFGLSMQYQHRAHDFVSLAQQVRRQGFTGHITCGGQFPTSAYRELLSGPHGIDSIVLHDGERTVVELLAALQVGTALAEIPGLALRDQSGHPFRTEGRRLEDDLDLFSFPLRYRAHSLHVGVPFIPIMGSRGCWGACSFCSIASFYKDARAHGGGNLLRHRSPENIAAEMALLWHACGGKAVFCFHDDNFLMPRPADSLARVREIRAQLDHYGVGQVAMIGKARPECVTPQLARDLAELGVIRLYVGVENVSEAGAAHLNRSRQTERVDAALAACRDAGIFACYNLLLFEPYTSLADVEENVAFMRAHSTQPVNFCRAEPYHNTPLCRSLAEEGRLSGSYLGYDYRMADDRAELLFRICASAFRQRNFDDRGVHNRYMGLGYNQKLIEYFYGEGAEAAAFAREVDQITASISLQTADFLEEAIGLARSADLAQNDRIERETALLGLRIAEADRLHHPRIDELYQRMDAYVRGVGAPAAPVNREGLRRVAQQVAQRVAVASWVAGLAVGAVACEDSKPVPVDQVPPDHGMVVDMVPPDAGMEWMVSDPPPPDAGMEGMVVDMLPPDAGMDGMIVDPPPPDAGMDEMVGDMVPPDHGMVVDMLPPDAGMDGMIPDPLPPDASVDGVSALEPSLQSKDPAAAETLLAARRLEAQGGTWRDTSPRRAVRSKDLPLFDPPVVRLRAERDGEAIQVTLQGGPEAISTRWEGDGEIDGAGREVRWVPVADSDQIRAGVRSQGGVAVVSLRAVDVA